MKKAFSLMEVVLSIAILSIVMVALLQIKSDNIYLVKKSDEKIKLNDYLFMAIDLKEADKRNENIFLTDKYNFKNDKLRREFKKIKVKIKDKKLDEKKYEVDNKALNIRTYSTSYSIKDDIKKNIYSFKLSLSL